MPAGLSRNGCEHIWAVPKGPSKDPSVKRLAIQDLVEVTLNGGKLNGGYALKRIEGRGEKSQWLLIKMR